MMFQHISEMQDFLIQYVFPAMLFQVILDDSEKNPVCQWPVEAI